MGFKIRKLAAAVAAVGAMAAGSANAGIVVNDWTLNLTGIDGLGSVVIKDIDQIIFTGIAQTVNTVNDGVVSVGDTGVTTGFLSGISLLSNGQTIKGTGLDNTFELTFVFQVANYTVSVSSNGTTTFTHLSAADGQALGASGLLKIYVDNLTDGIGKVSNQATGEGYDDGTLIATFAVNAGLGGSFYVGTFNGSDDASFSWVSGLSGVILDKSGNDLGNDALIAVTASQYDSDINNDGTPDVVCPTTLGGSSTWSPTKFCAQEDGRASLQSDVPEPATLALTGLALAGLGLARRRTTRR